MSRGVPAATGGWRGDEPVGSLEGVSGYSESETGGGTKMMTTSRGRR